MQSLESENYKILNFMRSLIIIGNQCRSFKMGVIWLNFEENVIKRAAAFCTYCSFLTAYFGRLYRRELIYISRFACWNVSDQ